MKLLPFSLLMQIQKLQSSAMQLNQYKSTDTFCAYYYFRWCIFKLIHGILTTGPNNNRFSESFHVLYLFPDNDLSIKFIFSGDSDARDFRDFSLKFALSHTSFISRTTIHYRANICCVSSFEFDCLQNRMISFAGWKKRFWLHANKTYTSTSKMKQ